MKPAKSILDKSFRYTPACRTDIRRTFANVRWQMEQERREREALAAAKVTPIRGVK